MHGDIGIRKFLAEMRESRSNEGVKILLYLLYRGQVSPSFLGLAISPHKVAEVLGLV